MVKVSSVAEALEQIRQGCTELNLIGACRGAALPTHRPRHRRTRMHACRRGRVRRASPERTPHARSPRPHRACAPPRVPQAIRSATRGPRSWPPRSRPTRPSPRCTSTVRAAAPPSPPRPPHRRTRMHACRRGACGAPAPSARRTRARRAHTARAPAPRATENWIGDEGAKELAAALKANATLTTLNLGCACRGTFHPATLPRRCTCGDWAYGAPPEHAPHEPARAHGRVRPACRRQPSW